MLGGPFFFFSSQSNGKKKICKGHDPPGHYVAPPLYSIVCPAKRVKCEKKKKKGCENADAAKFSDIQTAPIYSSDFFIYFMYTFSIYSNSFSIYCFSVNISHSPLPTYYYFKLFPFLLLLRPLTCSIFSQATLNPAQSERKKKESQPETSTPRHIQYRRRHRFENPTSAQVTMFSLSPSVNLPCSVLCSSKFQCLYFKVFVQVLCFDFVCVSMFCKQGQIAIYFS